jgi:hypothetical protein
MSREKKQHQKKKRNVEKKRNNVKKMFNLHKNLKNKKFHKHLVTFTKRKIIQKT